MSTINISVSCCLCGMDHAAEIYLPDGWTHRYGGIDDSFGFCPAHAAVAPWAESQCPGCVGGWTDCALWQDFANRYRRLDDADLDTIRRGVCPRRTGGTLMVSRDDGGAKIERLDLSEQATNESGEAFAQAILDYWTRYGTEE